MVLIFVVLYESQPKSNQITRYNVLDNFKFLSKNLYTVSCATLCYKSEVTQKNILQNHTKKTKCVSPQPQSMTKLPQTRPKEIT